MQQRRVRLGDILDDYCPRERRVTNHAVVAMIDDQIKQTRCTTCDADHEYKGAKVPAPRRKKDRGALFQDVVEDPGRPRPVAPAASMPDDAPDDALEEAPDDGATPESFEVAEESETVDAEPLSAEPPSVEDEGPVHRPLIRATLPRPEGQVPERRSPEFTVRQPGTRGGREFDGPKNGQRHGRPRRPARAQGAPGHNVGFGPPRHDNPRHNVGRPPRPDGNRGGQPGQRGTRPGGGAGRPRSGAGGGRKRGR